MKSKIVLLLLIVGWAGCFPVPPQFIDDPDKMENHEIVVFPEKRNETKATTAASIVAKEDVGSAEHASLVQTQKASAIVEILAGTVTLIMFVAGAIVAFLKFRARAEGNANDVNHFRAYAIALLTLLARMRRRQR